MAWPTIIDNGVERQPTTSEKALIAATSPLWGVVWLGAAVHDWNKQRKAVEAQRIADEQAEADRKARLAEEFRLAEEARAKEDDGIFRRTNQLLTLDIGGCIATIAKQYDTYTSVWEYRCTRDNLIIRTRKGDDATVCFHDSEEMMDDLQRYRWAGFELV